MTAPQAPWELAGECVVALVRGGCRGAPLPPGVHPLPGPAAVLAARFESSPVGAYLELAVGVPARWGPRPGTCITTMVVDSPTSRLGGRTNWGFPKELGRLAWAADADQRSLVWEDRQIEVRATLGRHSFPFVMPLRAIQRRGDGLVVVPARLRGWGRVGPVEILTPGDDELAPLAGRHHGVVVSGARVVVDPARRPTGLGSPVRVPRAAPALNGALAGPAQSNTTVRRP